MIMLEHVMAFMVAYAQNLKTWNTDFQSLIWIHNKRFLDLAFRAPGSTHDARFLRHTGLFWKVIAGQGLLSKTVALDNYGEIPLVIVCDSAFPRFSWLVKTFYSNTGDEKEKKDNLKLNSA